MANRLTFLLEILGLEKLDTTAQKLQALNAALSPKTIQVPSAGAGAAAGSLMIGGVALNANQIDAVERAARQLGSTMQRLGQTNPRLLQGILGGLSGGGLTPITATLQQIKDAFAVAPPVITNAVAGAVGSSLSRSMASLLQRFGTGIGAAPGLGAFGSMWGIRPLAGLISSMTGAGLVTVSAGIAALGAAITGAIFSIREFEKSVRSLASLYDRSSRLGIQSSRLAGLERILGAAGVSPEQLGRLSLSGEFMRGRPLSFNSLMLAARSTGDAGFMQQLLNERWVVDWAASDRALMDGAKILGEMSGRMKEISVLTGAVRADFDALKASIAGIVGTEIKGLLAGLHEVSGIWTRLAHFEPAWAKNFEKFSGLLSLLGVPITAGIAGLNALGRIAGPNAPSTMKQFPWLGMDPYRPPANHWERLGFVVSPFSRGEDYQRETAQNTKRIADAVSQTHQVSDRLSMIMRKHSLMMWATDPNVNLP